MPNDTDATPASPKSRLARNVAYPIHHNSLITRHPHQLALWTGEKRAPRKGEWYLSGAIIEAYQAPNDLTSAYAIAQLVEPVYRATTIRVRPTPVA